MSLHVCVVFPFFWVNFDEDDDPCHKLLTLLLFLYRVVVVIIK